MNDHAHHVKDQGEEEKAEQEKGSIWCVHVGLWWVLENFTKSVNGKNRYDKNTVNRWAYVGNVRLFDELNNQENESKA